MSSRRIAIAAFTLGAFAFAFAAPAHADEWEDRHAARCTPMFKDYKTVELGQLHQCLANWYQTRQIDEVDGAEKSLVAEAASRLYHEGDREQQYIGKTIMLRVGVTPPPRQPPKAVAKKAAEEPKAAASAKPKREKYEPAEVSDRAMKKARKIRKKGFKDYKKKKYARALRQFERALDAYPGYTQALYDAACTHALLGDGAAAVEYLWKLTDIDSRDSIGYVHKARVDGDFFDLREDPAFREVTGYVRVKITNGVGEYGEDEVDRIKRELEGLRHHVASVAPDKAERDRPIIWYKENRAAESAAYIFDKVLNHPNTKFNIIDWDTEFDVIISWGDDIKFDDHGDPIVRSYAPSSPADAEQKQQDLMYEQDRALREPETHARKVEHTVKTPERMEQRAGASKRRVESTIRTFEKTGKSIKGVFK